MDDPSDKTSGNSRIASTVEMLPTHTLSLCGSSSLFYGSYLELFPLVGCRSQMLYRERKVCIYTFLVEADEGKVKKSRKIGFRKAKFRRVQVTLQSTGKWVSHV